MMTQTDLKVGVKGQFDTCKRFAGKMTSKRLVSHFQTVGEIIRETLGVYGMMTPLDLETGVIGQI